MGPEVAFVAGEDHRHVMLTGNVTIDLAAPIDGRPRSITPFVVVGGGLFSTSEDFPDGEFTSYDGAFTAGGGVRAQVSRRIYVGAEARIGWELHLRLNGLLGVRFGD